MPLEIFDCEQGSADWFRCRMGLPTASEFHTVMAKGRSGGDSVTRRTYLLKLAGEILTDEPMEQYTNPNMERGKAYEDEARDLYAFTTDAAVKRVGFGKNFGAGASPDGLIGKTGGLEIKIALPHIQIERLLKNELPPEHKAQVQGNMWVYERQTWDFVSYCPRLPIFIKPVPRDDDYIATISGQVKIFNEELAEAVALIRRYGQPSDLREKLIASVQATGIQPDHFMAG